MSDTYTIDCFAGSTAPAAALPAAAPVRSPGDAGDDKFHFSSIDSVYQQRAHFESADTDRLNEAHWQLANELPVNDVLSYQLPTLRIRSNHEAINNPTVEGLMLSHTLAVAGEDGPLLDLQAEDSAGDLWCDDAEQVWEDWCRHADAAGQMSLASMLKQWNISCWKNGEFLEQLVTEETAFTVSDIPSLRLHGIETQRLVSPADVVNDPNVVLGIRRNKYRRPIEYWIADEYLPGYGSGNWINARNIMHGLDLVQAERGQARGTPWMQSGLPTAADARDYDTQVLDAARSAADQNFIAFTRHVDAEFADNVPAAIAYRRRMINFLAPGWETTQTTPAQPGAQYKDHRQQLHGDMGKPKGVPSMITRLDARDHNYSSARFDYQLLGESAKHVRATLYNPRLRRLVLLVLSEAQLMGLLRRPPARVRMEFVWPALPEIDDLKSAEAEQMYMRNGTLTYTEACAKRHGRRARDQVRRRQRDDRLLAEYGLPSVADATSRNQAAPQPTAAAESE